MDPVFNEKYKDLQQGAAEVMATLQEKVGTSVYISAYSKVREGVKQRREGRRGKRARDMMGGEDGEGRVREEERKRRKRVKEKEKRREVGRAKTAWRKKF